MFGLGLEGTHGHTADNSSALGLILSFDAARKRKKTERPAVRYKKEGDTVVLKELGEGTVTRVEPPTPHSSMKFYVSGKDGWEAEITIQEENGEKNLVVDVTKLAQR